LRKIIAAFLLAGFAGLACASEWVTAARADPRIYYLPPPPPPQGVGCYFFHGVRYCSRYCYWEVDGFRYCHPRASEAHSQAPYPLAVEVYPAPGPPPRRQLK
jgi:hypothetical protein